MPPEIHFYHAEDENGFLSNVYLSPIVYEGMEWASVEHLYQSLKFTDPDLREQIRITADSVEAKQLAYRHEDEMDPNWMEIRDDVMRMVITEKFLQNADLREALLATAGSALIEDAVDDPYWGIGSDGKGLNRIGEILMEQRDLLLVMTRGDATTPSHDIRGRATSLQSTISRIRHRERLQ